MLPSAIRVAPVLAIISSVETPGALSSNRKPFSVISITASSVTIFFTHFVPVSGNVHCFNNLLSPAGLVCIIATIIFFALATRSMAPPTPFTILPGIVQLAMSPLSITSTDPNPVRAICPALLSHNTNTFVTDSAAKIKEEIGQVLRAEDIADAIVHCLAAPPHVSINEVPVRPTKQRTQVGPESGGRRGRP